MISWASSLSADLSSVRRWISFAVWVFIGLVVSLSRCLVVVVDWMVSPGLHGTNDNVAKHEECICYCGYYFQLIPAHDSSGHKKAHRSGLWAVGVVTALGPSYI